MGCNIGKMTTQLQNGGGTLGPFVQYDGRLSFLTCAHVLFDISQSKHVDFTENVINRVDVVQPAIGSSSPSGDPCGFVQRAIFDPRTTKDISIDVAVVAISDTTRLPTKGRFAIDQTYKYKTTGFDELPEYNNAAYIPDVSSYGSSNMVVQFGCETHLTKGYLVVDGAHVRPLSTALGLPNSAYKLCMNNQYEVKDRESAFSFFRPGDSGAAVFMMEGTNLHCIGMSIGCTSYGTAVVTPIGALLDDLNFPTHVCSIAKFDDQ